MTPDLSVADMFAALERRGGEQYGGEAVTQLAHALQSAALAERAGASDALVIAALFHDLGHLVADDPDAVPDADALAAAGIDTRHEDTGAEMLARRFGPAVAEPVRLHVAAKRYFCAVNADYLAGLSPASVRSLALQGGPFSPDEAAAWIAGPFARDGLRLRVWDDLAKDPDAVTPGLDHYRTVAARLAG